MIGLPISEAIDIATTLVCLPHLACDEPFAVTALVAQMSSALLNLAAILIGGVPHSVAIPVSPFSGL